MNIPKELLQQEVRASGAPTQTSAVILGLEELILKNRLKELAELQGSDAIPPSKAEQKAQRRR